MLLFIHNIPKYASYPALKELICSTCGIEELILDNLLPDDNRYSAMKVTVAVSQDRDANLILEKINGLVYKNRKLEVRDTRRYKDTGGQQPQNPHLQQVNQPLHNAAMQHQMQFAVPNMCGQMANIAMMYPPQLSIQTPQNPYTFGQQGQMGASQAPAPVPSPFNNMGFQSYNQDPNTWGAGNKLFSSELPYSNQEKESSRDGEFKRDSPYNNMGSQSSTKQYNREPHSSRSGNNFSSQERSSKREKESSRDRESNRDPPYNNMGSQNFNQQYNEQPRSSRSGNNYSSSQEQSSKREKESSRESKRDSYKSDCKDSRSSRDDRDVSRGTSRRDRQRSPHQQSDRSRRDESNRGRPTFDQRRSFSRDHTCNDSNDLFGGPSHHQKSRSDKNNAENDQNNSFVRPSLDQRSSYIMNNAPKEPLFHRNEFSTMDDGRNDPNQPSFDRRSPDSVNNSLNEAYIRQFVGQVQSRSTSKNWSSSDEPFVRQYDDISNELFVRPALNQNFVPQKRPFDNPHKHCEQNKKSRLDPPASHNPSLRHPIGGIPTFDLKLVRENPNATDDIITEVKYARRDPINATVFNGAGYIKGDIIKNVINPNYPMGDFVIDLKNILYLAVADRVYYLLNDLEHTVKPKEIFRRYRMKYNKDDDQPFVDFLAKGIQNAINTGDVSGMMKISIEAIDSMTRISERKRLKLKQRAISYYECILSRRNVNSGNTKPAPAVGMNPTHNETYPLGRSLSGDNDVMKSGLPLNESAVIELRERAKKTWENIVVNTHPWNIIQSYQPTPDVRAEQQNTNIVVKKPPVLYGETKVAPGQPLIPANPMGSYKIAKINKMLTQEELVNLDPYQITPAIDKALDDEIMDISNIFYYTFETPTNTASRLTYSVVDQDACVTHLTKFLKFMISRRMADGGVKMLRIYGRPHLPKRAVIEQFLLKYECMSLKKSQLSPFYIGCFRSYQNTDALVSLGEVPLGSGDMKQTIRFKYLLDAPKPPKFKYKEIRAIRQNRFKSMIDTSNVNFLDKNWPKQQSYFCSLPLAGIQEKDAQTTVESQPPVETTKTAEPQIINCPPKKAKKKKKKKIATLRKPSVATTQNVEQTIDKLKNNDKTTNVKQTETIIIDDQVEPELVDVDKFETNKIDNNKSEEHKQKVIHEDEIFAQKVLKNFHVIDEVDGNNDCSERNDDTINDNIANKSIGWDDNEGWNENANDWDDVVSEKDDGQIDDKAKKPISLADINNEYWNEDDLEDY